MESIEFIKLQEMINKISEALNNLIPLKNNEPSSSLEIDKLAEALAKAQSSMPVAGLNKSNPFFKSSYADWQSIVGASRPSLSANGLSVEQPLITDHEGMLFLVTKMLHSSGQWTQSKVRINPAKNDIQSISSYITYMKRICYASLVGVVTGDEDDDGETLMERAPAYEPKVESSNFVSKDQLEQLKHELDGYPTICQKVLDGYKIKLLNELPREHFMATIRRIRDLVEAEKSIK